ncbi:MAG TPA: bacillithiol system redox-active protein YtxJ [Thermoanaerobaculia bacterium]|nr:bacillithiol system redox-active protein YtxJ [Thermoanaerobaculia bacterium]
MADIQRIENVDALEALLEKAKDRQVWIFKHSLTCPISGAAWAEFRRFADDQPQGDGTEFAVIEIQYARPVSTALAERTGVRHQSPQAILLREARVAWHASHYDIDATALKRA